MRHSNEGTHQATPYRNKHIAIIGMGVTGRSCTKFLLENGAKLSVFDKKVFEKSALCAQMQVSESSLFELCLLDEQTDLTGFDYVVLSPGIDPRHPALASVRHSPNTISDLDIFAQFNQVPCIGVTGSNGKSTVVDMLQRTLTASGKTALLGGNFGTCALDLLGRPADFIVLELSSFQLDISRRLPLAVACILNITEDHIDRHDSFAGYAAAKQKIFERATAVVVNRDDPHTYLASTSDYDASVSQAQPKGKLSSHNFWQDAQGLKCQEQLLIPWANIHLPLPHVMLNMQFVLAIHRCLNLPIEHAITELQSYTGLAHRFEFVAQAGNVRFINDSKATNPGACIAALESAHHLKLRTILIAGGDAKGADLSCLSAPLKRYVEWCIVFGKDAQRFLNMGEHIVLVENLQQAVSLAKQKAALKDEPSLVLLSPACASLDMFKNYQDRGEQFKQAVFGEAA
ncbi:UDP-N-acetylmuramoyl-L-alanine--D-glutamate ligase [Glaciecola sp. SC05]|uniref:UDP-N-acetylmuramoyl-L-alanine--D-glutamate ligase n=1 Tax=Glaciecola sp. SC05 TaxID=1987355 RepID=UPI003526D46C